MVNCYAEGGHLINATSNKVFLELKDQRGQPIIANVSLWTDNKGIAFTNTQANGCAVLDFIPRTGKIYSLKIKNTGYSETINFPLKATSAGYVLQLKGTAERPTVMVKNLNMPENILLMGRTINRLKLNKKLNLKSGDSVLVDLPLDDSVNHVIDLGLFDLEKKLLAERLVYVEAQKKYNIVIKTDKPSYKQREKVKATISITDENGALVSANVSVAVVSKQTLYPAEKRITEMDLHQLKYHNSNLAQVGNINDELIREQIVTGTWRDVMNYRPKGKINVYANAAGVLGYLKKKTKNAREVKMLYLYSKAGLVPIPVKPNGSFSIASKDLIAKKGETRYLIINKEFSDNYDLEITNYAVDFDTKLKFLSFPETVTLTELAKSTKQPSFMTSGMMLGEVVVKATQEQLSSSQIDIFGIPNYQSKTCDDVVCPYNVLNCPRHGGVESPVIGQVYTTNTDGAVRYMGCKSTEDAKKNTYLLKNIQIPQNFYLPDYLTLPIQGEEIQTTIFWEPNLNTVLNDKINIEFYTSDVKDGFKIIVQGLTISGLNPVFGYSDFTVK